MIKRTRNAWSPERCIHKKEIKKEIALSLNTHDDGKLTPKLTPYEKVEIIERKTCKALRCKRFERLQTQIFAAFQDAGCNLKISKIIMHKAYKAAYRSLEGSLITSPLGNLSQAIKAAY